MTREEAIQVLQEKIDYSPLFKDEREAIDMAIEALNNTTESTNEVIESQNDVIEVVRCKDCKWAEKAILNEYCVECTMYHTSCMKHGYCHHGERGEP